MEARLVNHRVGESAEYGSWRADGAADHPRVLQCWGAQVAPAGHLPSRVGALTVRTFLSGRHRACSAGHRGRSAP